MKNFARCSIGEAFQLCITIFYQTVEFIQTYSMDNTVTKNGIVINFLTNGYLPWQIV